MSAQKEQVQPIPVTIVDERRAAQRIVGAPQTFALTAIPVCILLTSTRRQRAVVSIVGTGVVGFGNNPNTLSNAVTGSSAAGAFVQGPASFELQSTNQWWAYLVSGANTTVSVISEVEADV